MVKKGKMIYSPPKLLDEIESVMKINNFERKSKAIENIVSYSRVGREVEKINPLMWRKKRGKK